MLYAWRNRQCVGGKPDARRAGRTKLARFPLEILRLCAKVYWDPVQNSSGMQTSGVYGLTVALLLACSFPAQQLTLQADSGAISGPFVATNGCIYQAVQTTNTNGGRAVYSFSVTNPGSYAIQANAGAAHTGGGSFYVNVDAEPQDPEMIWDIPAISGFEKRWIGWRGKGTALKPQFKRKTFQLTAGVHQLIVRGREADTQLRELSIFELPPPPSSLRVVSPP